MSEPISDGYIDGIIKANQVGIPDPSKTSGKGLRELVKSLRDHFEEEIADIEAKPAPDLQEVTEVGATTDLPIVVSNSLTADSIVIAEGLPEASGVQDLIIRKTDGTLARVSSGAFAPAGTLSDYQLKSEKNEPVGYAGLDSGGKILLAQIPDSLLGNLKYGGTYNGSVISASDSFPELEGEDLPITGYTGVYFISTASFSRAGVSYAAGDWIVHNGSNNYVKVDNTNSVSSIFGRTGVIVANAVDYEAYYVKLGEVYTDPSWISSLAWSKITGKPSTLAGYGISDAAPASGSGNYIQNQNLVAQTGGFSIAGDATVGGKLNIGTTSADKFSMQYFHEVYDTGLLAIHVKDYGNVAVFGEREFSINSYNYSGISGFRNGGLDLYSKNYINLAVSAGAYVQVSGNDFRLVAGDYYGKMVHSNTADRTWTFPDASGTIALLSDISASDLQSVTTVGNTTTDSIIITQNGNLQIDHSLVASSDPILITKNGSSNLRFKVTDSGDVYTTGKLGIGVDSSNFKFTLSANLAPLIGTSLAGTVMHLGNADNFNTRIIIDGYGTGSPTLTFRKARTSAASPSAVKTGDFLANITANGYGETMFQTTYSKPFIQYIASEDWNNTAQGTYLSFWTSPHGGNTALERLRIANDGGVSVFALGSGLVKSTSGALGLAVAGTDYGTVSSVGMSVPTGLSISGTPITTSGTLALTFTAGYSIPTTVDQSNWNTAYGWGNHASAGYYLASNPSGYTSNAGTVTSVALSVTATGLTISGSPITGSGTFTLGTQSGYAIPTSASQSNWNTAYGWGNHAGIYLPLTGGTLTGALNGTSATFSGHVDSGGYKLSTYLALVEAGTAGALNLGHASYWTQIKFNVAGYEKGMFSSGGFFKASNTGLYNGSATIQHEFCSDQSTWTLYNTNSSVSPAGLRMVYTGASPNGTGNYFISCFDSSAVRFEVSSNGGIRNYSANNTNLSDKRVKKNIVPMESQWEVFKTIEFSKFKYKDQTHDDYNYGVIAQQVHEIAPHFVDTDGWGKKKLWAVYDADIHYAAHKALQEALMRIEELEDTVKSLSN